jgi:hypothetical protein
VGVDDFVDFLHEADRFVQGDDDLLVVGDVVLAQRAALAVLEPLVADLVAAKRSPASVRLVVKSNLR